MIESQDDPMRLTDRLFHKFAQRTVGDDRAMIHHHNAIAASLNFLQLVSRKQHSRPLP